MWVNLWIQIVGFSLEKTSWIQSWWVSLGNSGSIWNTVANHHFLRIIREYDCQVLMLNFPLNQYDIPFFLLHLYTPLLPTFESKVHTKHYPPNLLDSLQIPKRILRVAYEETHSVQKFYFQRFPAISTTNHFYLTDSHNPRRTTTKWHSQTANHFASISF